MWSLISISTIYQNKVDQLVYQSSINIHTKFSSIISSLPNKLSYINQQAYIKLFSTLICYETSINKHNKYMSTSTNYQTLVIKHNNFFNTCHHTPTQLNFKGYTNRLSCMNQLTNILKFWEYQKGYQTLISRHVKILSISKGYQTSISKHIKISSKSEGYQVNQQHKNFDTILFFFLFCYICKG